MRPYPDPTPRSFSEWCQDFGLKAEGKEWPTSQVMAYDEFCYLPETRFRKVQTGPLYNFWQQYGDIYGEPRTVEEWLHSIGWHIVEPTPDELKDLNLFLGHDEFWEWGSGIITPDNVRTTNNGLLAKLMKFFTPKKP